MATKCPALVNFLILGIGVLLVGYVILNFVGASPFVYSAGEGAVSKEGFASNNVGSLAQGSFGTEGFLGSGAGDFCAENSECGSGRCGQLDGGKRRCF
jgi:hypothetical protein